jgi:DNA-binding MarR family transcriptional regulator
MNMPTHETHETPDTSQPGLASALRISVMRLSRRLRAQRVDSSLSITELAVLGAVERHGTMTPRALAEHEKVQPPSMTRVINSLEEQGLLSRSPHPSDRRQVTVTATERGRSLVKAERRRKEAWLARQLETLTDEEIAALCAAAPILEKLSQA